jgi:hypothetical protein
MAHHCSGLPGPSSPDPGTFGKLNGINDLYGLYRLKPFAGFGVHYEINPLASLLDGLYNLIHSGATGHTADFDITVKQPTGHLARWRTVDV